MFSCKEVHICTRMITDAIKIDTKEKTSLSRNGKNHKEEQYWRLRQAAKEAVARDMKEDAQKKINQLGRNPSNVVVVVVVDPTPPTCCQQSPAPEIMWQPAVSPPRWQGKAPLCRDSSRGPG